MTERSLLLGLIGSGIDGSLSPQMQEGQGKAKGIPLVYRKLDLSRLKLGPADVPELFRWCVRLGFDGLNITHPAKYAIVPSLDSLSAEVRVIGAVNTVVIDQATGATTGSNTDWSGFIRGLRWQLGEVSTRQVTVLGAGGAGAAVTYGLLRTGSGKAVIYDHVRSRAEELAERMTAAFSSDRVSVAPNITAALDGADGLVQATPTGMSGHPGLPLPADLLRPDLWVADVVYFPMETELVKVATATGCRVAHGGGMAIFQAAEGFTLFTGQTPDIPQMVNHFQELIRTQPDMRI
jgi:shikimate dehydrogenase